MVKTLVICCLLSISCLAQTKKAPVKSKALVAAEERAADAEKKAADLQQENENLKAIAANLKKQNDDIRSAAADVLKNDQTFALEYQKLLVAYNSLSERHEELRVMANNLITNFHAPVRTVRPVQPYIPPPPQQFGFNCTSNQMGGQINTSCQPSPWSVADPYAFQRQITNQR